MVLFLGHAVRIQSVARSIYMIALNTQKIAIIIRSAKTLMCTGIL